MRLAVIAILASTCRQVGLEMLLDDAVDAQLEVRLYRQPR